jgi:dienelactone hydrolase
MRRIVAVFFLALPVVAGCSREKENSSSGDSQIQSFTKMGGGSQPESIGMPLKEARQGFQTKLVSKPRDSFPVATPPSELFEIVNYDAAAGKLPAYLTPDPKDGKKHPAIIWITAVTGQCNSIGPVWFDAPKERDETAAAYRKDGIIMMFPSLRGGNHNPGQREGLLGEVDDVLAAADLLAQQNYVDPQRIYLGGHCWGSALVLLVSEYSDRFRAVFSFGPGAHAASYGYPSDLPKPEGAPQAVTKEHALRSPLYWLESIKKPTFVFEGRKGFHWVPLRQLKDSTTNSQVQFFEIRGADHFNDLAPTNRLIAQKILADSGPTCNLSFTEDELANAFSQYR